MRPYDVPSVPADDKLAREYGAYASYATEHDPHLVRDHGDTPWDEIARMVEGLVGSEGVVLDLGCGAGFHLCGIAPDVGHVWGFEQDTRLLEAARQRVAACELANVTLIEGNNSEADDFAQIPDGSIDLGLSIRGPNLTPWALEKMQKDGLWLQEFGRHYLGLAEAFGRGGSTSPAQSGDRPDPLLDQYAEMGALPVSIRTFFVEHYFRDAEHLEAHLSGPGGWMPGGAYEVERDRPALERYCALNDTPDGIELTVQTKVYLFRRV